MKVKIKTWQEMEQEFGLDEQGDINCDQYFVVEMEADMPKDRIIEIDSENEWGEYIITEDMIKEKIDKIYVVSKQNIANLAVYLEEGKEYEVIIRNVG